MTDHLRRPIVEGEEAFDNDMLPWHHLVTAEHPVNFKSGTTYQVASASPPWWFGILAYSLSSLATTEFGWDIHTAEGTWDIGWFLTKRNDYPIVDLRVDGVAVESGLDLFTGGAAVDYHHETTGVQLSRGLHRFTIKNTNTRNASSTGWVMVMCGVALGRTA